MNLPYLHKLFGHPNSSPPGGTRKDVPDALVQFTIFSFKWLVIAIGYTFLSLFHLFIDGMLSLPCFITSSHYIISNVFKPSLAEQVMPYLSKQCRSRSVSN